MNATTPTQRRRIHRKATDPSVIRLEIRDGMNHPRWVTADLVDLTDEGFGLNLRTALKSGSTVTVRGKLGDRSMDNSPVGVRWCVQSPDGTFRAGLEFLHNGSTFTQAEPAVHPDRLDCYEAMELSPNADPDTIARVYRILALRYHPDNAATGSSEKFVRLSEAYQILSDPEKRAGYDVLHCQTKQLQWKIFDHASAAAGPAGEKRKRNGILALLYAKTAHDPEQAEMTVQLLEELLGCPREHLQAVLWYLKGKHYIQRSDSGRYSITVAGFEEAELQSASAENGRIAASVIAG